MKAILVLDEMPENCMECQLRFKDGDTDDWFRFRCFKSKDQIPKEGRLWNCELKPMPERKCEERAITRKVRDTRFESGFYVETLGMKIDEYAKGFNACIDDLLGEEE